MKFKENGWALSEIENLTTVQYKKYFEAISRKEIKNVVLQAKIYRISMAENRSFEAFVDSLERKEKSGRTLTEKDLKKIGFGKRKKQ